MEYQFLNIMWFILLVVLFAGYVILDGFDLGAAMLHKNARTDEERRIIINSIGPVWDGNEVWLITAGGALFAAFPDVYATVFSGFYTALMLVLLCLILRIGAIEFRSKVETPTWRNLWDNIFHISSYLIAILLGVALGNIISGVPIDAQKEYAGTFFWLLHPFAIFLGLTAAVSLRLHGMTYLLNKTEGELQNRIKAKAKRGFYIFLIMYLILTAWNCIQYPHMTENLLAEPVFFIFPALILLFIIRLFLTLRKDNYKCSFVATSVILGLSIVMVGIGTFPNLLFSNPNSQFSLNIMNAASSEKTLMTMFIIACIGVPIVLLYTIIVYRTFRGKVKIDSTSY